MPTDDSDQQKRHTLTGQLVIDFDTGQFLAVASGKGHTDDLRVWRTSEVRWVESY